MTLQVATALPPLELVTPSALTPQATDTIADTSFGPNGVIARIITTGTATNVTVVDPHRSALGNLGSAPALACPSTGSRMLAIPRAALAANGQATLTFSGALTGVTYELYRY